MGLTQEQKWPADKVERRKTDSLVPYARNSRTHSEQQVSQIAASIKEWGWTTPVLIDEEGGIIAGHGRVLAAQKLGIDEVPTMAATGWTKAQKQAYVLADNQLPQNAGWDMDLLSVEMKDLDAEGFDLSLMGFNDDMMADMLKDETEGLTDEDDVPEVDFGNIVTVEGDVWVLGKHRVMCGDSTSIDAVDKLMGGVKADMVFTDPPYGVDYDGGHAVKGKRREKLQNDATPEIYDNVMPVVYAVSKDGAAVYLWFSDSKSAAVTAAVTAAGYDIRNTLIWNKNVAQFGAIGAQYKSKHEPCLYCFKRGKAPFWGGPNNEVSVWDIARCAKNEHHPTQKPVELAERAFGNSSKAGDVILDLFGGSGSTLIACEKTGRENRSMELDPKYCDVIIKRWCDFTGEDATLEANGKSFSVLEKGLEADAA
jgi:DNA modification methylase